MKKKNSLHEYSLIKNAISNVLMYEDFLNDFITVCSEKHYSKSKTYSRLLIMIDIVSKYGLVDATVKYNEYLTIKNPRDKLSFRYNENRVHEYELKMKARARPQKTFSILTVEFWLMRGLSHDEAVQKISEIQSNNAKKRTLKPNSYKNHSSKIKFSLDYWLVRGYSHEEATILRKPYLAQCDNSLPGLINKYGELDGNVRYNNRILKYKKTMLENLKNRRTAGYVSVESKKFFTTLYKKCRRLGLKRSDIYFGVEGSREFFIQDVVVKNTGRFVDFCIPSLGIVIEYNGIFWHPRDNVKWCNPWVSYEDAMLVDNHRKQLIESRDYQLFVVWSDDNLHNKLNELTHIITEKYNE